MQVPLYLLKKSGPHLESGVLCRFSPGDISKEIPLHIAVTKYSGFTLESIIQSPLNPANPEYLVTSSLLNRYRPGENNTTPAPLINC